MATKKSANKVKQSKTAKKVEDIRSRPEPEEGAKVALNSRQVKVTNFNFKPEKHGNELMPRVDMSLQILLDGDEVAQFLLTDLTDEQKVDDIMVLWDEEGTPLLNVSQYTLPIKVEGSVKLGAVRGDKPIEFDNATLKHCTLDLMLNHKAQINCQVRVDPTGHMEMLRELTTAKQAKFSFRGASVLPSAANGDDDAQGELPV